MNTNVKTFTLPATLGLRRLAVAGSAVLLMGCTSSSRDGGIEDVARMTQQRIAQPAPLHRDQDIRGEITALLAAPLGADTAVRVALLNNHGLQAALAELAVAEADFVQAGHLPNPGFRFGQVRGGGETDIDRGLSFNLAALLTLPSRAGIERSRFEQTKLQAALQAVTLAADTRKAYYAAVATAQALAFAGKVREAAEAAAELGARMRTAGNWSALDAARERAFYHDAETRQAQAHLQATAAREALIRLLGLADSGLEFTLPDRLPDLPDRARTANTDSCVASFEITFTGADT